MGGKPKEQKPQPVPRGPAPVRADAMDGSQAYTAANRRQGLRSTMNPANPLAPSTALGAMGRLGVGGEGVMVNDAKRPKPAIPARGGSIFKQAAYEAIKGAGMAGKMK